MVKLNNPINIEHNGNNFVVLDFKFKGETVPVILNEKIFKTVKSLDKSWFINDKGFVVCTHTYDGKDKEISMHDIVMKLYEGKNYKLKPIVHLNRLGIDNRYENLIYDETKKSTQKNLKKKDRIIDLEDHNIYADDIPTFVWYLKGDKSHGARFVVDVGNTTWKTTSSNKLSLRYKLEEAKKYLRSLKKTRPDLFEEFSMNGDLNRAGNQLLKSFYEIIGNAGNYDNINVINGGNNTDILLEEDLSNLSLVEKYMLKSFSPLNAKNSNAKSTYDDFENKINDILPEFCYYHAGDSSIGDYFYIDNHPNFKKILRTTSDINVSLDKKLQELKALLKRLE